MISKRLSALMGAVALIACAVPLRAQLIWLEAEQASPQQTFRNAWFDAVRTAELSGGAWLNSFSEPGQPRGSGRLDFQCDTAGSYTLWLRVGGDGHIGYQLNDNAVVELSVGDIQKAARMNRGKQEAPLRYVDERNLAGDGNTDARYLGWLCAGAVTLTAGPQTLELRLGHPDSAKKFAGVDVVVLARDHFVPNGEFKPGQSNPREMAFDPADMWTFDPPADTFSDQALVDLRSLNEPIAGGHGFIRLSADGEHFVRGDGEAIRFWGGTDYNQRNLDLDGLKQHARFLAKRGVNVVRWHGDLPVQAGWQDNKKDGSHIRNVDPQELDEAFKLVAAMKDAGIYTVLSPYWGSHTKIRPEWKGQFPDPGSGNLAGLVFFVPEVEDAYKHYLRALYTQPNPYTGVPLKDEPAVAIIQLQNEDSLLFFTAGNIKGEAGQLLKRQYRDWLIEKYGSTDAARQAWSDFQHNLGGPDWQDDLPNLLHPWDYTRDAIRQKGLIAGFGQRRADNLEFLAGLMRRFNQRMQTYLRDELGARQLINAGNWKTVDPVLVDDAERWSYTANEVIAKNHYFGALHTGRTRGWQILPDHIYTNESAAANPRLLPTSVRQVAGHPFIIPESLWVPPNQYQAEGPLMVAAHSALIGLDTFYWFCNGAPQWEPALRGQVMPKWSYATPMQLGQFPAAALIFRRGMVRQADPVVIEHRQLNDIWQGRMPLTAESAAFDPNRDEGLGADRTVSHMVVDPLAFLVGPVHVRYSSEPGTSRIEDVGSHIDRGAGVVSSLGGQLTFNHSRGVFLINTPRAQAVVGALNAAQKHELADVTLTSSNDYGAISVVALDDQPIAASRKLLVQIGTFERPRGWKVERITLNPGKEDAQPACRIVSTGEGQAWQIRKLDARLSVANPHLTRALGCDANFMPTGELKLDRHGEQASIALPADALYVVLK